MFSRTTRDPEGAIAANNRGVAYMERFEYGPAADLFREARKKDPDWLVPRINLAIALLNFDPPSHHDEVVELLTGVLKEHPDDPHANYTLGCLRKYQNNPEAAYPYFEAVLRVDPGDAHSWLYKGICHPDGEESEAALACFRKALELNPYLNVARHKLFTLTREPKRRRELQADFERLHQAFWEKEYKERYYDMGPYAEVIGWTRESHPPQPTGPLPAFDPWEGFRVQLAPGSRWADAADLGEGPEGDLRRLVRERFGATLILFDYNRDGRPDVLLLSAVVRDKKLRNLLLRNEGDGRFTDVTAEAGLADSPPGLGCAIADFDNDDSRDILMTGVGGVRLYRNTGKGAFADVTATAGMDQIGGVCLAAGWVDLDQDSDLDAVIGRLADDPPGALRALQGESAPGGRVEVFFNRGDPEPVPEGQRQAPLKVAFGRASEPKALLVQGAITGFVFTDLDDDKDVDILVLADGKSPIGVRNDRLLRFSPIEGFTGDPASWTGGAALDINHDGRSDIVLLRSGKPPLVLLSKPGRPEGPARDWFATGSTNSPPLVQAGCVDLDADGWTDVIGLSSDRKLVFLHNDGENRLVNRTGALGPPFPDDSIAVAAADLDGDCHADILVWSESMGLRAFRGQDNGNTSIRLELSGRYEADRTRTNADGIGCKVVVQAGRLWTGLENTSLWAGLGQSRLPLTLGLGRRNSADSVRVVWPDGVPQAELDLRACDIHQIHELNRKPTSCPILSVWDGNQFRYVTDFLGAGALGESGPDGSVRPPRPEESVKIEPGVLVPKDGKLVLKIAEPMDELMYLDRVRLVAIDHPKGAEVHPDERFAVAGPPPTQDLLVFDSAVHPVRATDHHGRDVTAKLRDRDKNHVTDFARRSWLGYAEEHFVDLDFGDRLSKFKPDERLFLVMAGWTDYAYPESIYAATQAGIPTTVPTLERLGQDGMWQDIGELGFPAGLPRVMTREVTGLVAGPSCRLRIRTNLCVYWDKIVIAPLSEVAKPGQSSKVRVTPLDPSRATLAARGFIQEVRPNGRSGPVEYDDGRTETVAITPWRGMLTKLGDVTELLQRQDDCFVLCGPGDEVTIQFDGTILPPTPEGYVRSYVLRAWGYCKDTAPTTVTGGRVEPLPFHGMRNYPHFTDDERHQADEIQAEYRRKWNTRPATGGPG
ncbi:MAG: VCBS repeat-containing protein [Zavarzinella sp.]|nr:VCBS repeat-containing protein [Zavarzinella sp.]